MTMGCPSVPELRASLLEDLDRCSYAALIPLVGRNKAVTTVCINEIRSTTIPSHRSMLALILADSGFDGASDVILDVLGKSGENDQTGTLLHALNGLGGTLPIKIAFRLIEHGCYLTHMELIDFFEEKKISFEGTDKAENIARIEALMVSEDPEVSRVANEIMEIVATSEC